MPEIAEPLRPVRVLAKPKGYPPLGSFSCGRKGRPWERSVNNWARSLYQGREAKSQMIVVLECSDGKLVGLCSFLPHQIRGHPGAMRTADSQRIHMLGIAWSYQGKRLEDGSRLSDILLGGAIEQIEVTCGGRMPYVSALISPKNGRSRALFVRHGFRELPYTGKGEIRYIRAPEEQGPVLRMGTRPVIRLTIK
jgi:hypothetical protein